MKSSRRSRSRRHRNPHQQESNHQSPFFSKSVQHIQAKEATAFFQPKLTIGQPEDKYEQEADAVANQVVNQQGNQPAIQRQKVSTLQRESLATPVEDEKLGTAEARMEKDKLVQEKSIQKMDMEEEEAVQAQGLEEEEPVQMMSAEEEEPVQMQSMEEEEPVQMQSTEEEEPVQMQSTEEEEPVQMMGAEEEEEPMQMKAAARPAVAAPHLSRQIKSRSGKGKPLPQNTRTEMEQSFGIDFSGVNVHTDGQAVQLNRQLGAHAFTHGSDIYFNSGRFQPDNQGGKQLLAHELTHVVQQQAATKPPISKKTEEKK